MFQPLGIFVLALGAGFLIPLFGRLGGVWATALFFLSLVGMTASAGISLLPILGGAPAVEILTAGVEPPFSINLRFGAFEGYAVLWVNLAALLGAWHYQARLREHPAAMLLYLILVMGINGMVMTRDLFNLFIFIEISAIATYGLLGFQRSSAGLSAGFKYIIATSLASTFFLLGTSFLYYLTGTLNIDDMIARRASIIGPIGFTATLFLLASLLIELKPFPANGWGLDVYETAPSSIAALISVGVSTGVIFALFKLLPLFGNLLTAVSVAAGITFLISNLIGLKQTNARRLLGYSSIGQMALIALALALLTDLGAEAQMPLILGGLFLNHLLAKAGLFWLAGVVERDRIREWSEVMGWPGVAVLFGIFIAALVGLPPFPGFWAKWELVMQLAAGNLYGWIALVLVGSLLEAAYLFRWLNRLLRPTGEPRARPAASQMAPVLVSALLLLVMGAYFGMGTGIDALHLYLPLCAGALLYLIDGLPSRVKGSIALVVLAAVGYLQFIDLQGLSGVFGLLLLGGGWVLSLAALYRGDARRGFYPLLVVLILAMGSLLQARTSLELFFAWEVMTLSSYLLVGLGRDAIKEVLVYLLFSLGSAYCLLAGFGVAFAATGSLELAALGAAGDLTGVIFSLLALGFLIKAGGLGLHIWLPGAYGESDDDFSAILSSVVSKASIFGLLLVAAQLGVRSEIGLDPAYVLGWIGMLTAVFGALMAVFQEDIKRLLAYSSMGQLGYIITAVALMSHLGWVAGIYLAVNHFLFKGILFLAAAGVVLRTGERLMYRTGGLINNMPFTFVSVLIGIIAVSGVPPLTGFGGKWLLFNALMEKGWLWLAVLAFFSSAVAFLYLFRLIYTVFLGQRKHAHREVREAPMILLLPQYVLIVAIMVFSLFPWLLIEPISTVVDPYFATTLVWEGVVLQTHLGYWNQPLVMGVIAAAWVLPLLVLLFLSRFMSIQRVKQFNIVYAAERPDRPETTHFAYDFYAHYETALGFLVRPRATAFWNAVCEWTNTLAASLRTLYTGNGQTYALFVLMYLLVLYFSNRGIG